MKYMYVIPIPALLFAFVCICLLQNDWLTYETDTWIRITGIHSAIF
jgi:hypothetical protein